MSGEVVLQLGSSNIYLFSLVVLLAFLWGSFVFYKKANEYHLKEETVLDSILLMGLASFLGARIFYVLTRLDIFANRWARILFIKQYPGMSSLGMVLGILLVLLLLAWKKKENFFDWLDLVALGFSAGLPIVSAGQSFLNNGFKLFKVIPLSILEAVVFTGLFSLLWWLEGEYRTFEWYRFRKTQAKSGFVVSLLLFCWTVVKMVGLGISKSMSVERVFFWIGLIVLSVVIMYIRSGRSLKIDTENMGKGINKLLIKVKRKKEII